MFRFGTGSCNAAPGFFVFSLFCGICPDADDPVSLGFRDKLKDNCPVFAQLPQRLFNGRSFHLDTGLSRDSIADHQMNI